MGGRCPTLSHIPPCLHPCFFPFFLVFPRSELNEWIEGETLQLWSSYEAWDNVGIMLNTCLFTCLWGTRANAKVWLQNIATFCKPHLLVRFVLQFLKRLTYLFCTVLHCNVIALHVILTDVERSHFLLHTFYNWNTIQGVLLLWVSRSSTGEWTWKKSSIRMTFQCILIVC